MIAVAILERRAKLTVSERNKSNRRGKKTDVEVTVASTSKKGRSRPAVAKAAKVSERKLRRARAVRTKAPEMVAAIRAGEKTILDVEREIRERDREKKREANRELVKQAPATVIAQERLQTIVLDPPWDWGAEGDADQFGRARPVYATMSIEEIAALPVADLAADNAHIYLWITNRSLPKGFALLESWGFRYVTALTWCKPSIGMGSYFRGSTEHVLFGVRGSVPLLGRNQGTHFTAPRPAAHSGKPPEFYELVDRRSPGPWLEMFARRERAGWICHGAEIGSAA
jgi:N6-adenosine-specific RNA methylase IME4